VVQFKTLDYRETQPGARRVDVQAAAVSVLAPVGESAAMSASWTVDSISGASPLYHTQKLTRLKDFRRAWTLGGTVYANSNSLGITVSNSQENDYFSRAAGVVGSWSSADRNTTVSYGAGASFDLIRPVYGGFQDRKRVRDALVGLTQVVTPHDIVQFNLSSAWSEGNHTEPYKILEERPRFRRTIRMLARWNHHRGDSGQILRSSYRISGDTWGVRTHTAAVEWLQPLGRGWSLTPSLRGYLQTAARFYLPVDSAIAPSPPFPPIDANFYSADQRLSAFGGWTTGLRLDKAITPKVSVDLKVEHYEQRSGWAWDGHGDAGLAPFRARWLQFGLTARF
jgi:hypothetical protein